MIKRSIIRYKSRFVVMKLVKDCTKRSDFAEEIAEWLW
jgi:hypothetical protein